MSLLAVLVPLALAQSPDPFAPVTDAEPTPVWSNGTEGVGFGVVIGLPTGLTAAWRPAERLWGQTAVAWSFENETFALSVDALYTLATPPSKANRDFLFPVYVGGGVRLRFGDGAIQGSFNDAILGIRVPMGMCFQHQDFPVEAFVELAPGIGLVPDTVGLFDFGIGARFYIPSRTRTPQAP